MQQAGFGAHGSLYYVLQITWLIVLDVCQSIAITGSSYQDRSIDDQGAKLFESFLEAW